MTKLTRATLYANGKRYCWEYPSVPDARDRIGAAIQQTFPLGHGAVQWEHGVERRVPTEAEDAAWNPKDDQRH